MKIKNIKFNKKILGLALTGFLALSNTGCTNFEEEDIEFDFSEYKTARETEYYNFIFDSNKEYYIQTTDILSALPAYDTEFELGLKVNEDGNAMIVHPNEDPERTFHCSKTINSKTKEVDIILGKEIYCYEIDQGYRLIDQNDHVYDLKKVDLEFTYRMGLDLETEKVIYLDNPDGGPDHVIYKKKK